MATKRMLLIMRSPRCPACIHQAGSVLALGVALAPLAVMAVKRIDPDTAREKLATSNALLVCGYDDRARCRSLHIEGAIDLVELQAREAELPRDREIIFYCA
jgi:hypothetical protein